MSPREAEALSKARMILAEHPELADDDEFRADVLEGQTDILTFADRLIEHLQRVSSDEEALRIRIASLDDRKRAFGKRKDTIRETLRNIVSVTGKLTRPLATLSVTTGRQQLVIAEGAALPAYLTRVTVEPDKSAISDALKAGALIPGCSFEPAPDSLLVRVS